MKYSVSVVIEGAGTGTDSSVGLYNGDLKWVNLADSTNFPNYTDGIIDHRSFSDITSACNIANGGAFGGFQGDVTARATNTDLRFHLASGSITLIGKKIRIFVGHECETGFSFSQRYVGIISAWSCLDEVTTEIISDAMTAFDRKKIGGIAVTKEMALNDSNNEAIGKNVQNVYGYAQNVDFPAVYVSSANIALALSVVNAAYLNVSAPKLGDMNDPRGNYSTESGSLKGATLFGVQRKFQNVVSDNVKIMLFYNGNDLFGASCEYKMPLIRKILSGCRLKVVRGSGVNEIIPVINVMWEENDDVTGVWIEIGTTDINLITAQGGWVDEFPYSGVEGHKLALKTFLESEFSEASSNKFNASYSSKDVISSVSYISILGMSNLFLIHGSANTNSGCMIVGKNETTGKEISQQIPVESISTVYEYNDWKMIQISASGLIFDDESTFWFRSVSGIRTQVHSDVNGLGVNSIGVYFNGGSFEYSADHKDDGYQIESDTSGRFTHNESIEDGGVAKPFWNTVLFVPIEDIVSGIDLSRQSCDLSIIPHIYHEFSTPRDINTCGIWNANFSIDSFIIGEGNTVLEQSCTDARYYNEFDFGSFSGTPSALVLNTLKIELNPVVGAIQISGNNVTEESDYSAFRALANKLNISDSLKAHTSKQIRGVLIQVRGWISHDYLFINQNVSNTDIRKWVSCCYMGFSSKVNKDDVYIRCIKDSVGYDQKTPSYMVAQIATDCGISIDSASFQNADSVQRLLIASESNSQFMLQPNSSFSDVVNDIATQSMMAVYQKRDEKFYCKWFANDDANTGYSYDFLLTDIIKGSVKVSKPQSGYLYTDFNFKIKSKQIEPETNVFVNSDSSVNTFPDSGDCELIGYEYKTGIGGYTFENIDVEKTTPLYVRKNIPFMTLVSMFPIGTKWRIGGYYSGSPSTILYTNGVITSISPTLRGSPNMEVCIGFSEIQNEYGANFVIDRIQLYGPNEKWLNYVSGSFLTEYTLARNIWESAQSARLKLGVERKMPSQYTTLTQPVWGSDSNALMQWILYTVVYNTREKTVIKFSVKMNANTLNLNILDYVRLSWGAYSNGILGWIVEMRDNVERGEIDITMLTSISDTDAMIIDERFADGSTLIDENPVSTNYYDEGMLA